MDVKKLQRIRDVILANPEHFDMDHWFKDTFTNSYDNACSVKNGGFRNIITPWKNCGTTACIAGWALSLYGDAHGSSAYIPETAANILGLTWGGVYREINAPRLFYMNRWPKQFVIETDYNIIKTTAKLAAARIDHFIKTNGME